jgi:hypothetical protein
MKKKYDVTVVGGGLAGLITGGLLAKSGLETLIVERDSVLGGRCQAFDWNGFRCDKYPHVITAFSKSKDVVLRKAYDMLGVPLELNDDIKWRMAIVGKKGQKKPEFTEPLDVSRGGEQFMDFFNVISGITFSSKQRAELRSVLEKMASLSDETCEEFVGVRFKDWAEENIKDPTARAFFQGNAILGAIDLADFSTGRMFFCTGACYRGDYAYLYPSGGLLMDTMIDPLGRAVKKLGCDIVIETTVKKINVEDNHIDGVWLADNRTAFESEVKTSIVVCTVPVYSILGGVLNEENFTKGELNFIKMTARWIKGDYIGYYFLDDVVPHDFPGWLHVFDQSAGIPAYKGDIVMYAGTELSLGGKAPKGKQLLMPFFMGGVEGPLGIDDPSLQDILQKSSEFEGVIEKGIPGFSKATQFKSFSFPGEWGRYCYTRYDPHDIIGVKSEAVKRLYFAGDTVYHPLSHTGTEKVAIISIDCAEAILRDLKK